MVRCRNAAQDGGRLASLTSTNLYGAALQGLGYDYDNSGNILGITDSVSGEISEFTYDALERLLSMTVTVNGQTSHSETFSYADPHGRMVNKSLNGVSKAFTYDANHPHAAASLGENSYTYDLNGSQVGRVIGSTAYTLTYDGENRMIRVEPVGGMAANSAPARRKVMALQFAPTQGGDFDTPAPVFTFTPTLTRTPTPTATATLTPLPTGTATPTPEPTPTPDLPPTGTAAPTQEPTQTPDLPPTETPTPTPEPPTLESAQYFYDGDGTLVKSIVNGEVTYYVSRQFHLRVSGEETRIQKYYPFGGQPIAVRTQANGTDTLNWLLTDHLGSAQVTAAEGGAASGVQRYTAFGEVRSRGGEMPTVYQYTGQLSQMEEVGLYHYGARWYDPTGAHFTQADTLIPGVGNPLSWDRYAYVNYSPLVYVDPTGHKACSSDGDSFDTCTDPLGITSSVGYYVEVIKNEYGVNFAMPISWNLNQVKTVFRSFVQMENGLDRITGEEGKAWIRKNLVGTILNLYNDFGDDMGSFVSGRTVFLPNDFDTSLWFNSIDHTVESMIIHELGHVWDNTSRKELGDATYYGGGYGDALYKYMGGDPVGLRWTGGVNVPRPNRFPSDQGPGYGNNSPADYFAHAFIGTISDSNKVPQQAKMWMTAFIDLTK